ncbi:DUF914 domain-containing protein [Trichoderma novae-zelandiae]
MTPSSQTPRLRSALPPASASATATVTATASASSPASAASSSTQPLLAPGQHVSYGAANMTVTPVNPCAEADSKFGFTTTVVTSGSGDKNEGISPNSNDLDGGNDGNNNNNGNADEATLSQGIQILEAKSVHWWSYFTTADFWAVIAVGQVLSLCITGTNTFTSFLANAGTNIPAFQTVFNYILLFLIYTTITLWRDGPRVWLDILLKDGWRYLIMSFLDVEGNYFTVLAYRYTNLLSAQLLNFWSIVCVVIISFFLLRVRYKLFQVLGILICCGGMGILLASDHITGSNGGPGVDMVKGDLFGLLGATLYGVSNVFEEWLVSKRPMHHVLAFMGFFGMFINGIQAAIFDRESFRDAHWDSSVGGWLAGYTICLCIFYTLAPLILRMGSAAFFDISLLTANFWGVIIGIHVFGYAIHFLYPIAFVCIVVGLVIYFLSGSMLGDSKKPWLGENQEDGVAGFGTAKLRAINAARKAQAEAGTEAAVGAQ